MRIRIPFVLLVCAACAQPAFALDGGNPVHFTVPTGATTGWKTFEIISGGDVLGDRAVEGFAWDSSFVNWDGLGAYRHDDTTLRLFINFEKDPGAFSRVDLDVANLQSWIASGVANNGNSGQVAAPGTIVREVSPGWLALGSGSLPLQRPCSGNVWLADTFGPGRGFADGLYLFGEEVSGGQFWVMDLATRTLYAAADLGSGRWENATPVDTGRTDTVALFLSEDAGSSAIGTGPLRLYVGLKNPGGNFLERNGLSGGTFYYWNPDGAGTNGTMSGIFAAGNGAVVSGEWVTGTTGEALFSKSEDVHVNTNKDSKGYGVEVALACEKEAVFKIDFSGVDFVAGALGANRTGTVSVIFAAGTQDAGLGNVFDSMDNLVWSADGRIYVNEDDEEGDVWVIDPASLEASYAALDFSPDATQVHNILDADIITESSGIIDVSEALGYLPGSVFLIAGYSNTAADNQVAMAVSPQAALRSSVYRDWIDGFVALTTEADRLKTADPDADGLTNEMEFALDRLPHISEAGIPVGLTLSPGSVEVSVTPARSLNLVTYQLDYGTDSPAALPDAVVLDAGDLDEFGTARVAFSRTGRFFTRLRVTVP